jgi:hypothetical protein
MQHFTMAMFKLKLLVTVSQILRMLKIKYIKIQKQLSSTDYYMLVEYKTFLRKQIRLSGFVNALPFLFDKTTGKLKLHKKRRMFLHVIGILVIVFLSGIMVYGTLQLGKDKPIF